MNQPALGRPEARPLCASCLQSVGTSLHPCDGGKATQPQTQAPHFQDSQSDWLFGLATTPLDRQGQRSNTSREPGPHPRHYHSHVSLLQPCAPALQLLSREGAMQCLHTKDQIRRYLSTCFSHLLHLGTCSQSVLRELPS